LYIARSAAILGAMLNLFSIVIGVVALLLGIVPFLPFFAWGYWFVIPIAIVGAAVGSLSSRNSGRNLNLILILIFGLRLMLGGGLI
jgi:hypothetical protein